MAKTTSARQTKILAKKRSQPLSGLMRYYQPVKKNKPSFTEDGDGQESPIVISTESEGDNNDSGSADGPVDLIEPLPKTPSIVLNVWTEKYKPTSDDSWIGDRNPVSTLLDFLTKPRRTHADNPEDDDELIKCYGVNANAALLTGSHGWGKTCLVYAIAKQSNMKVLEMNSSTRRSGKTITTRLREATQTHLLNVKSDKSSSKSDISKFFIRKSAPESISGETSAQSSTTISQPDKFGQQIILFDDVDVIFEGKDDSKDDESLDTGFWRSLKQLIRESKVPVILTATDHIDNIVKCKLNDIKLLTINIPKPNLIEVRNHLTNICAQEFESNCDVDVSSEESINRIDQLIMSLSFDVRKCINQLNFSGESFFAPVPVPKRKPIAKKKRGRQKRVVENPVVEDPLKPYHEAALISDISYISSCNCDLSSLVPDCSYNINPATRGLTQRLQDMSTVDQVESIVETTSNFIDDSFSSISCKPSILSSKVNQIVDILPFLSVICQVESQKGTDPQQVLIPAERQKTRRRSRLQGLPYFEAIESFRLHESYRNQLCTTYQSFAKSFEFYDSDATDIDE